VVTRSVVAAGDVAAVVVHAYTLSSPCEADRDNLQLAASDVTITFAACENID
jgi:hypothetical protein